MDRPLDDPSQHLALCPNCQSVFALRAADMEVAHGAVRCGECKKIFNATYNLIAPEAETDTQAENLAVTAEIELEETAFELEEVEPDELDFEAKNLAAEDLEFDPTPETLQEMAEEKQFVDSFLSVFADAEQEADLALEPNLELESDFSESNYLENDYSEDAYSEKDYSEKDYPENNFAEEDFTQEDSFAEEDADLKTEQNLPPETEATFFSRYKQIILTAVAALVVAGIAALSLGPSSSKSSFAISSIQLAPASTNPKQMQVHFTLENLSQENLNMPKFNIELLNLSGQVISQETVYLDAEDLKNAQIIPALSSKKLSLKVQRPSTFVQEVRIKPEL